MAALPPAETPVAQAAFVGAIETVDTAARTFRVKATNNGQRFTIAYRDDTKIERAVGIQERLDEYLDANNGKFPFTVGDQVTIEWKHNATTNRTTAVKISRPK